MRPIRKQSVSNLLDQLNNYHDLRYTVNLPEAEVYEYANNGVAQARPEDYDPQAFQDLEDRRKQTIYQKWMESDDDSLAEDVYELFDPTGIYSHDDAREARRRWQESGEPLPSATEFLDMIGAIPLVGYSSIPYKVLKGGRLAKPIGKLFPIGEILERAGFLQDRTQE